MASSAAPEPVAVVGDGSMGTTLAHVMASRGRRCLLWCHDPAAARAIGADHRHPARPRYALHPELRATPSLEEAVDGAALVIVAVHSTRFRETARELGALVGPGQVLLSATKGIELPSLSLMSEILGEGTRAGAVGAITGLNVTPEIMEGQLSALLVASPSPEARALAAAALAGPRLRVEGADDLRSHELAAVLKNVVAIAVGMAAGGGMGFNAQGLLFARGLAEIEALGARLGAAGGAFRGMGGVGDLFLTASSPQSLNRRLGVELGSGATLEEVLRGLPEVPEGIGAVRGCRLLARRERMDLPLAEAAARILEGEDDAGALERALIQDPPGASE